MSETTTTYAIPPGPDGPVWDQNGVRWDINPVHGLWCGPGGLRRTWIDLLRDHGPLTNTEPAPEWPTAPHVWWDGGVWMLDSEGTYQGFDDYWEERHMRNSLSSDIQDNARRFAREAVPVVAVPAAEWETLRRCVEDEEDVMDAAEVLIIATGALNGETNE